MKYKNSILALIIFIIELGSGSPIFGQDDILQKLDSIAIIERKVMMPMRDGVRLATDIIRPKTDEPVPVIFVRTPYDFNSGRFKTAYEIVKNGYAFVLQNERGKYFSEGEWDILGMPVTDGYDALTWMADQPWSNGKVGLMGCSSSAEWQMALASLDHPALAAMIPMGYGAGVGRIGNWYEQGNWFHGGAVQMLFVSWLYNNQNDVARAVISPNVSREDLLRISRSFNLAPDHPPVNWSKQYWHLPITNIIKDIDGPKGTFEEMIRRKPNDPAWYEGGLYHDDMPFTAPSMWFVSWYDISVGPNIALFNHVRENAEPEIADNQFLIIAPTLHCRYELSTKETIVGERNMGDARLDYNGLKYDWFDYWLKGEENDILKKLPRVQYYTMGSNKWQSSETWPPKEAQMVTYYLESDGKANSLHGDGILSITTPPSQDSPDAFIYDPKQPVPSYGGNICCDGGVINGGSFDQQKMEIRDDILVYSTDKLEKGIEVSGTIKITLYVSSDVKDTDFTVKLIDVYPDGKAYNLDETIQRVRYREGYDKEVFMEKGKVYKLPVSPMTTSNYFAAGHRIRIEVSSSNFPRFSRNLNTGGNNYDEKESVIAHNKVHHSAIYPSQIVFPIVQLINR